MVSTVKKEEQAPPAKKVMNRGQTVESFVSYDIETPEPKNESD